MSLQPGTAIGPYVVAAPLGAGGMGEVFRARDTRLGRDVALKVLPSALSADPARVARFEREARALAAISHPHIAQIYGVEETPDGRVLVMELVPGQTLAARLSRDALTVGEALELARQIAIGLEAAHAVGIVHRDLKPANVQITGAGTAKILDFGLAKALEPADDAVSADAVRTTVATPTPTGLGQIIGTPAYMSPEQARGGAVDKRTDVWAFGCVLFEMLAGRPVFHGASAADTLASVLTHEPDWRAVPATTPASVLRLVRRCLSKHPERRLHDIADARIEIEDALQVQPGSEATAAPVVRAGRSAWFTAAAALALPAAGGLLVWLLQAPGEKPRTTPTASSVLALPLSSPVATTIEARLSSMLALSPEGTQLAYVGERNGAPLLWLRRLDEDRAVPVEGSEGATGPVFSPDGASLAFVALRGLLMARADGGKAEVLVPDITPSLGGWGPGGVVYGIRGRLLTVGGPRQAPVELVNQRAAARFRQFRVLPDGRSVVASYSPTGETLTDDPSNIGVVSLADGTIRPLVERAGSPHIAASRGSASEYGHLLYARGGQIWAAPFHRGRGELLGEAVVVLRNVTMRSNGDAAQFAVSETGTLVYQDASPVSELVRVDADGAIRPLSRTQRRFAMPRLSPDGRQLAVEVQETPHQVWLLDIERDALSRLTFDQPAHNFAWHPGGQGLVFASVFPDGRVRLAWKSTVRAESEVIVFDDPALGPWPFGWSRDGTRLAVQAVLPGAARNVHVLPFADGLPPKVAGGPIPVATTRFDEHNPSISADGRLVAYVSDETGRGEVYVHDLDSGARTQVSAEGGAEARWASSGHALYFRSGDRLMRASVQLTQGLRVSAPVNVRSMKDFETFGTPNYDLADDGRALVAVRSVQPPGTEYLNIRFRWFDHLHRVAPIP